MRIAIILFSTLLVLTLLSTCYYDSEEYLFPQLNNSCDTTGITFTLSVKPILENNCYSCHSNSTSALGGNIKLENHADLKIQADNGHLIGSITHAGGFSAMPQGAPQLESCRITVIRKWIEAGSLNN